MSHKRLPPPAEMAVLLALCQPGASMRSVAHDLGISYHTVKNHMASAYQRLGVNSLGQAIYALMVATGKAAP